jgi:hypothetical protein
MKKIILAVMAIGTLTTAIAQKEVKYAKIFYRDMTIENGDFSLTVDHAVSTDGETKFKLTITNKTSDYILYKPEESKFVIDGKEMQPVEKWKIISPNDNDYITVNLKGSGYNAIKNYQFIAGGLYRVSSSSKGIATPDYKLPVSANEFTTGPYSVKMNKLYKESDATNLKFDITYNGDKTGVVNPLKSVVKMPDGNEYASVKSSGLLAKTDPLVFTKKGQTISATLNWKRMEGGKEMDMQKVEMLVEFKDMFTESTPEKMKVETLEMVFDEVASNAKGK